MTTVRVLAHTVVDYCRDYSRLGKYGSWKHELVNDQCSGWRRINGAQWNPEKKNPDKKKTRKKIKIPRIRRSRRK